MGQSIMARSITRKRNNLSPIKTISNKLNTTASRSNSNLTKLKKTTHLKPRRQRQIWRRSTYQWMPPAPNPCKGDLRLLLLLLKILRPQDGRSKCRGFRAWNRVRSHILDQKKEKPTEKLGFSREKSIQERNKWEEEEEEALKGFFLPRIRSKEAKSQDLLRNQPKNSDSD